MPAYQPPHLRNRPPGNRTVASNFQDGRPSTIPASGFVPAIFPNPSRPPTQRPSSSTRNWQASAAQQSSRSVLASPANDLRPSNRSDLHSRPRGLENDMEFIQSVSRSGGDGAEGDALKDWRLQERYRRYIDDRLDKHHTKFPGSRDKLPPPGATDQLESLSSIVLLYRKLREGVVASGRIDPFAIEVFEASVTTAIFAHNTPQVISSLSGLVPGLYQAVDAAGQSPLESTSINTLGDRLSNLQLSAEAAGRRAPDRRAHFASLLLLFHLCHSASPASYHSAFMTLTRTPQSAAQSRPLTVAGSSDAFPSSPAAGLMPFLQPNSAALRLSSRVHRYTSADRFDPISFWRLLADPEISGAERTVISWAGEKMRERAWEVMRKSYMEVDLDWAGAIMGICVDGAGGVEDLARKKGHRVEKGRIKLR